MSICAVIMAGGSGSRLWPSSRASYPKQFLVLDQEETLLQATMRRAAGLGIKSSVTICNEAHRFFVAEQLREIGLLDAIILEPVGRNTAPAIALAAFSRKDDPLLLVLAADNVIEDEIAFNEAINHAIPLAEAGKLVSFGIVANEPHTGYGYIKKGAAVGDGFIVDSYVEKPPIEKAKEYIRKGGYFWNSGMFLFRASRYLDALKEFSPDIYNCCELSAAKMQTDLDFLRVDKVIFDTCPSDSIDYAVMERTSDAVVVPMDAGWNDIGSWSSLWDLGDKDEDGNVVHGDVLAHNTNNCFFRTEDKLVAAVGISDLIVVNTKDAVLIAHKDQAQDVKLIIDELKTKDRHEWSHHREIYRPWGKYDSVDHGDRYQVKRITVKPGAKLSVQMHHHRAEHWVVVSGTAKVLNGEKEFLLSENQSTYIPVGAVHSLENPGKVPLELIEVQSGSYLAEDDIVRFEDIYGREGK